MLRCWWLSLECILTALNMWYWRICMPYVVLWLWVMCPSLDCTTPEFVTKLLTGFPFYWFSLQSAFAIFLYMKAKHKGPFHHLLVTLTSFSWSERVFKETCGVARCCNSSHTCVFPLPWVYIWVSIKWLHCEFPLVRHMTHRNPADCTDSDAWDFNPNRTCLPFQRIQTQAGLSLCLYSTKPWSFNQP